MLVQKARQRDFPQIVALAETYGLDYSGMAADDFWVVKEQSHVRGIVGLKQHRDCLELCSLGVDEEWRSRGIGTMLVRAFIARVKGDVYLATIIPSYFEKFGFKRTSSFPPSMAKKADWCEGCRKELCAVMVRQRT